MKQSKSVATQNKRKRWPWILVSVLVLLFILIMNLPGRRSLPGFNVREVGVEKGSLTLTVVGTGQLAYDDPSQVEIAPGLLVDQLYVESGDKVAKGDPLAAFDPLSIQLAIDAKIEEIAGLDVAIGQAFSSNDTEVVRAQQSGRIKAVHIEKDDFAADVYENKGAVMLISLDDRMAVAFESTAELLIGESVQVIFSDASTKKGTVEKRNGSAYTVSLTANGPDPGEIVTVQSQDEQEIGEGELYIQRPLSIIATKGTVKSLHVSNNQKIYAGNALFTLKDLPVSSEYDKLLADRETLKDELQDLLDLQKTGVLWASSDQIILETGLVEGKKTGDVLDGHPSIPAFTMAPSDQLVLMIQLDELDVLSVQAGQDTSIRFDAIGEKTFHGTIDQVATQAVEAGGMAKYPARILIASDEQMRIGMNVTATIKVDEKADIQLLPVAAIQESGGRIFVYTSKDEKSGELSGEVDVTTGLSDGDRVEITEGLNEGITVYYRVASGDNMLPFSPGGGFRPGREGSNGGGAGND